MLMGQGPRVADHFRRSSRPSALGLPLNDDTPPRLGLQKWGGHSKLKPTCSMGAE